MSIAYLGYNLACGRCHKHLRADGVVDDAPGSPGFATAKEARAFARARRWSVGNRVPFAARRRDPLRYTIADYCPDCREDTDQ